ncbi:unnamed protein product [Amoebophrya sp. A120]|nr:unnamed protein product [Amoebophrya sp. A120]|eukprot:GSA120T00018973001.1
MFPRALSIFGACASVALAKTLLDDTIQTEQDARARLQPVFGTLSKLDAADIEYVVRNHFWDLATEIVAESHKQSVDLSFAVRKAVKDVRNKADELIRYLNPKYHEKQKVVPVFRWAQSDTHIFLTIKYSVKWDAPGAVNVKDPQVVFNDNVFSFTASGEHSGNKYEYSLNLDCFDAIDERDSTWSAASVGRFTAILAKKRMRRWPRLLLDKKKKGTGRMDLTRQEELDKEDHGSAVAHSEKTCLALEKVYCPTSDKCLGNCTTCTDWDQPVASGNYCSGPPKDKPISVQFTDTNMDVGVMDGELKIELKDTYHVESFVVKYGRTITADRSADSFLTLAEVPVNRLSKYTTKSLAGLKPLEYMAHDEEMAFAVYPKNSFGVLQNATFKTVEDAYVPKEGPIAVKFADTNGDPQKLSGEVEIVTPVDPTIKEIALYFGKKAKNGKVTRTNNESYITAVTALTDGSTTKYVMTDKAMPTGATGIIAYSKNTWGENRDAFIYIDIVDAQKPCSGSDRAKSTDCPPKVKAITEDAASEANYITVAMDYEKPFPKNVQVAVYLSTDKTCHKASNYKLIPEEKLEKKEATLLLDRAELNGDGESWRYTHLATFTKNEFGTSKFCSSIPFKDVGAPSVDEAEDPAASEPKKEL